MFIFRSDPSLQQKSYRSQLGSYQLGAPKVMAQVEKRGSDLHPVSTSCELLQALTHFAVALGPGSKGDDLVIAQLTFLIQCMTSKLGQFATMVVLFAPTILKNHKQIHTQ